MQTRVRVIWILSALALMLVLGVNVVNAQGTAKPTYVIAFIPMKWNGSLDEFDRAARRHADLFVRESGIEKYARVEVRLVHNRLDNVDLRSGDLLPAVVEFGLKQVPADRYVGLTNGDIAPGGRSNVVGYTNGPDSNGVVAESEDNSTTAHELGHTFKLCDEYSFVAWERENLAWGCPNPYPPDCPKTALVDCLGNETPNHGRCIMGPAGLSVRREFDQADLDHLDKTFARMFGRQQPTPTPGPTPTPPPMPVPQTIAFVNNSGGTFQLYTMRLDGAAVPRRVSTFRGDVFGPSWSPDGTRLAFASTMDGNLEIYTVGVDGSNLTRLTNHPARDESPTWSPDGKYIAFVSDRDGNPELYLIDTTGTNQTRLTSNLAQDLSPTWAPDGKRLAFVSDRDGHFQIYVLTLAFDNGIRVLETKRLMNSAGADITPTWSRDGKHIAFASNRDGNLEIYVADVDGMDPRRLTANLVNDWAPVWLKGGEWLAFQSARGDAVQIHLVSAVGGTDRQLVDLAGSSAAPATQR